jgi:hypothetical protein
MYVHVHVHVHVLCVESEAVSKVKQAGWYLTCTRVRRPLRMLLAGRDKELKVKLTQNT